MTLTVGSLFSGIGGLDLGLEQAGMRTVWQVEYDDWAREKLQENFPHTEKFKDVRHVGKHNLKPVDLIAGGFPCTDISTAKYQAQGLDGERSGLWFEMFRIIGELRPKYTLIENVANLINLGLERVLCDLASIGYDAEWQTLRASSFGQPTRRRRFFIVAYPTSLRLEAPLFKGSIHPPNARGFPDFPHIYLEDIGRSFVAIPEHLRVDTGVSVQLRDLKPVLKGYGNSVAPPVAKWIGERIIEFNKAL